MGTKTSLIAILAASALGVAAYAETLTPAQQAAKAQMASHMGVDPNDFTMAELTQMNCRLEAADSEAERKRLLRDVKGFGAIPAEPSTADKAQLAGEVGVDPSEFTARELAFLKAMIEQNDCGISDPVAYVKGRETLTPESAGAKQQLAESMGVSPTEFTLKELVLMKFEAESDDG